MNESRRGGELKVNASRFAGPGLGLGTSALQAPRPAAFDDNPARLSLHLEGLLLDDRKDRQGHLGSSQVLPTCTNNLGMQSQGGSKRGAGGVGSIVSEAIALTHVVRRSLLSREVCFNPTTRIGTKKKPPEVAIAAVKQNGGRAAFGTARNATK
jgi:hypothetical protein